MWYSSPSRQTQTTIPCDKCSCQLMAKRSCHEAYLYCPDCQTSFTIGEYSSKMDDALETFLEGLFCDRT